jgi:hypothetical protein
MTLFPIMIVPTFFGSFCMAWRGMAQRHSLGIERLT